MAIHLSLIMDCFVVPPRNDVPAAILSPHDDEADAPLGRTMTYPALGLFWPWPARHRRRGMAVVGRRMGNDSRHCEMDGERQSSLEAEWVRQPSLRGAELSGATWQSTCR